MKNLANGPIPPVFSKKVLQRLGLMVLAGASTLWLHIGQPALAGDPFRLTNPKASISETSEQVFYAMFRDGDYVAAQEILENVNLENADASANGDPMFHALGAAFSYLYGDLDGMREKALQTQGAAEALSESDPLRSNLYEAVGTFLEGAHILETEGIAQGTPRVLGKLQQVFDRMDAAEAINPADPELSLLKGYMDLFLAVNLPFANPERAIERLETYGYPEYVSYRGIAIGYRDLDKNSDALEAVEVAIAAAPNNPELLYLKGQLLLRLGRTEEGIDFYGQALEYADQLPLVTTKQIAFEQCRAGGEARSVCKERVNSTYNDAQENDTPEP